MKFLDFLRRLIEAFRHVRSGGRTTRTNPVRRPGPTPRWCTECGEPVRPGEHHEHDEQDDADERGGDTR